MPQDPRQGEIWLVEFEPNVGSEIDKTRPALVVSVPGFTNLPMRIVVPIRGSNHSDEFAWFVPVKRNEHNRLTKDSEVDASQIHAFDLRRFVARVGKVSPDQLEEVRNALALCLGF